MRVEELRPRHLWRWMMAGLGIVSVGFAVLGAVLPGLPTTIFLILASYFFTRSCPWLEERLMRNRLFAPYMAWIDGRERMPRRAKGAAIAAIWIAVGTSLVVLYAGGALPVWLAVVLVVAAAVGTVAVANDWASRMLQRDVVVPDSAAAAE